STTCRRQSFSSRVLGAEPATLAPQEVVVGNGCLVLAPEQLGGRDHRLQLSLSYVARQILHAAIRREDEPVLGDEPEGSAHSRSHDFRSLNVHVGEVETSKQDLFVREVGQDRAIEVRLRCFNGHLLAAAARELRKERVTARPLVNDRGVAKADMNRSRSSDSVQGSVQGSEAVL